MRDTWRTGIFQSNLKRYDVHAAAAHRGPARCPACPHRTHAGPRRADQPGRSRSFWSGATAPGAVPQHYARPAPPSGFRGWGRALPGTVDIRNVEERDPQLLRPGEPQRWTRHRRLDCTRPTCHSCEGAADRPAPEPNLADLNCATAAPQDPGHRAFSDVAVSGTQPRTWSALHVKRSAARSSHLGSYAGALTRSAGSRNMASSGSTLWESAISFRW
jgi:hypothetical protein